jgi:hypothetical protein
MPKGPQGQKRPADVTQNAVMVMKIATGEVTEEPAPKTAAEEAGSKGGKTRAAKLSPQKRSEIARKAAAKRWKD